MCCSYLHCDLFYFTPVENDCGLARKAPGIDVSALRQQHACMICWVGLSVRIGLINNIWTFLLIQDLTRAFD